MPEKPYLLLPEAINLANTDTLLGVSKPSNVAAQFSLEQLSKFFMMEGTARYNYSINGSFQSTLNGSTHSNAGNVIDMWGINSLGTGGAASFSRSAFTTQTEIPGNPSMMGTWNQTIAASTESSLRFLVDASINDLANQWITVSFWASSANPISGIGLMLRQNFGTGGSPSSSVDSNRQTFDTSAVWQKYTFNFLVPSIIGKTLGTLSNTAHYRLFWYFPSGSTFAFRVTEVKVERGLVATRYVYEDESHRIHKYYQIVPVNFRVNANASGQTWGTSLNYWRPMRGIPVPTIQTSGTRLNIAANFPSVLGMTELGARYYIQSAAAGDTYDLGSTVKLDAMI